MVTAHFAEVELDPSGIKVERDSVGGEVLRENALELVKRDITTTVRVKEPECDLLRARRWDREQSKASH